MKFVDTGAWFAGFVPTDPDHDEAVRVLDEYAGDLVTSDYIIDELLTLLVARGERDQVVRVGRLLFDEEMAELEWVTRDDVLVGWKTMRTFRDKGWSFTDCVSRAQMLRLDITEAIAFDHHFNQFGTVAVLP